MATQFLEESVQFYTVEGAFEPCEQPVGYDGYGSDSEHGEEEIQMGIEQILNPHPGPDIANLVADIQEEENEVQEDGDVPMEGDGQQINLQIQPPMPLLNSPPNKKVKRRGNLRRLRGKRGPKESKQDDGEILMESAPEDEVSRIERLRREARKKRAEEPSVNVAIHMEAEFEFMELMES